MQKVKSQSLSEVVKDEILNYINTTCGEGNNKLPTEEKISEMLGVSRITVRTALNDLANDGIIFRRQGKGTFVNLSAINMKVPFSPVILFYDMIKKFGYKPSVDVLRCNVMECPEPIALDLNIEPNSKVVFCTKLFYADKNPCAYCVDYFPVSIMDDESNISRIEDYQVSLFDFFQKECHRKIIWDKTEISTITNFNEPEISEVFQCGDKIRSFLLLDMINYDENDNPIMRSYEYIDTTYIKFNSIRQKAYHK